MKKIFFGDNCKFLRESRGLKQDEMLSAIGFKRTTWNGYEKNKSFPKVEELIKIAEYFDIDEHSLLKSDLANVQLTGKKRYKENIQLNVPATVQGISKNKLVTDEIEYEAVPTTGLGYKEIRVGYQAPKVVTIDSAGKENILYVPVKARAGYLLGYGDSVFIESLAAYRLPGHTNGTYRIFETDGLSMFPTLQDNDRVIARWTQLSEVREDRVHVLITKNDGLLIKRVLNRPGDGVIVCKSDNNNRGDYPNIVLDYSEIVECWYVVERWTRTLPNPGEIYRRITDLEGAVALLMDNMRRG